MTDHELLDHHDGTLRFVDAEPTVRRLAATIDALRPDTVVTFGPDGLTGHTGHVTVSRWTTAACAVASHPTRGHPPRAVRPAGPRG